MLELNLQGKTAVVTGGANGLRYEIAKAYYEAGADLCIVDIAPNIAEAAKSLEKDREVKYYSCNLAALDHLAQYEEITSRIPMKRWGVGQDLGGAVVFLAGNAANYITGAIIPVDGGYLDK